MRKPIAIRREKLEKVFSDYLRDNCSEKGEQKSNLTFSQRNGLRKLKKRIQDGELLVMLTDKSGKLAVADVQSYIEMGSVHTSKAREVGEGTVRKIQKLYNGHTSMWLKMARVGEKWEHEDRLRESCLQQTCNVAPMYLLEKDHKPRKPGQLPATRPVVSGCSGMGLSLSNLLSDHLESIANSRENPIEVISTEDLLSRIHEYNEKLSETNPGVEKVLIGGDCVNLFPSLLAAESGRIVRESTIKIISQSNLTVDGLDYRELAKYVRMNMSDYEIITRKLSKIVPVRKYTRGAMPGMRGSEAIRGVIPEDEELMRDILDKAKIERHLEGLYVDDLQYVLSALPPGVRWSQKDKSFIHREDWRIEDESSKESSTRRTSREICQAMNSVYKSLNFTVEIEIDFEKLRLPTLDCELFMNREKLEDQLQFL